jgi:SAM-dependent methyltransferase
MYSPFYAGAGIRVGAIWNPELGILRWRHMLADHVPVPLGGRILDLGPNNGFNALQMLRAGAKEVVGVEIDPAAIEQGLFVKRVFEWADNTEYCFSYIRGSHADVGSMNLGRFDLITAFCTLYYLSRDAMAKTVSDLAGLADTLVLECNDDRAIKRDDPETFIKASLSMLNWSAITASRMSRLSSDSGPIVRWWSRAPDKKRALTAHHRIVEGVR